MHLARGVQASQGQRRQREDGLADLVDTARDLTCPHDVETLLQVVTRRVKRLLNVDMTSVALLEPEGDLHMCVSDGSTTALATGHTTPASYGLGHPALAARAPLWTADYLDDDSFAHDESADAVVRAEGLHAVMAVPMCNGEQIVGVLYSAARSVRHFSPVEIGLVCSLAALAAIAIERAGTFEQVRDEVGRLEQDGFRTRTSLLRLQQLNEAHSHTLGLLLADDHDVDGYIQCAIGPVLDYDRERLTDLTGTLESYFASGGSQAGAADTLNVHPNTVARRLDRVTDLLGDAWQQPGRTLEVQLALRLHRSREVLRRQRRVSTHATDAQAEASSAGPPLSQ
ncbi:GAF domain-containing protein [Streptomyces sp. NPDC056373]|uniref:GAF domain-containing protein n=1 Tax=Streptomyces sp. NPDC056373 TaxID=3345798 RepID=UPI0035DAA911